MISMYLGHKDHSESKLRYLAPIHDECFAQIIIQKNNAGDSVLLHELQELVSF